MLVAASWNLYQVPCFYVSRRKDPESRVKRLSEKSFGASCKSPNLTDVVHATNKVAMMSECRFRHLPGPSSLLLSWLARQIHDGRAWNKTPPKYLGNSSNDKTSPSHAHARHLTTEQFACDSSLHFGSVCPAAFFFTCCCSILTLLSSLHFGPHLISAHSIGLVKKTTAAMNVKHQPNPMPLII